MAGGVFGAAVGEGAEEGEGEEGAEGGEGVEVAELGWGVGDWRDGEDLGDGYA